MSELIVVGECCDQCGDTFSVADNYCRNCGRATDADSNDYLEAQLIETSYEEAITTQHSTMLGAPRERSLVAQVLENRFYVISILLCAGPIGLPALWFSRRFSRRAKIITTAGYFLFTVVVPLVAAWYFLNVALRPIVDALR